MSIDKRLVSSKYLPFKRGPPNAEASETLVDQFPFSHCWLPLVPKDGPWTVGVLVTASGSSAFRNYRKTLRITLKRFSGISGCPDLLMNCYLKLMQENLVSVKGRIYHSLRKMSRDWFWMR